jgi:hypothetical protein
MANVTRQIVLNNFTPGIHSSYHGGAGSTVPLNGAAVVDGTYRCCSDLSGALVPLPRRRTGRQMNVEGLGVTYPPSLAAYYVMDGLALSRMYLTSGTAGSPDGETIAVALTTHADPSGGTNFRQLHMVRLYQLFRNLGPAVDIYWAKSEVYTTTLPSFVLSTARNENALAGAADQHIALINDPANRAGLRGGAIPADEQVITSYDADTTNGSLYPNTISNVYVWPAVNDADTSTLQNVFGRVFQTYITGHQGRLVTSSALGRDFGASTRKWNTDRLAFNRANTLIADSFIPGYSALNAQYGEENTSGIGFIASTSADELLIVKNHGGGYVVRGDLENPSVARLPFIESTYGVTLVPAYTPLGLVYGTRNGVFVWGGGDASEKLSKQLDGHFFRHSNDTYSGNSGRMDYWHPWVCVPNNYLYDTRTESWWRLEDPAAPSTLPFHCYSVVPSSGKLVAFSHKVDSNNFTLWSTYDPEELSSSYNWRSQPLIETKDRVTAFQDCTLVATGPADATHTVTVTFTGYDKEGAPALPATATFTFDGTGQPVILKSAIRPNLNAMYVQVNIAAVSDDEDVPAPKIHSLTIGVRDNQSNASV